MSHRRHAKENAAIGRAKPVCDAALCVNDPELRELILLLLGDLGYSAEPPRGGTIPPARIIIVNLDEGSPALPAGRPALGISSGDVPGEPGGKYLAILGRPFGFAEFRESVRKICEGTTRQSQPLRIGGRSEYKLTLDASRRTVSSGGRRVDLTPNEFKILSLLIERQGGMLTRAELAGAIGGGTPNITNVYICTLRRKISTALGLEPIKSVRGQGYMIN